MVSLVVLTEPLHKVTAYLSCTTASQAAWLDASPLKLFLGGVGVDGGRKTEGSAAVCEDLSVKMCATVLRKCARLFTALCPHCSCSDSHVPRVTSGACDVVSVLLVTGRLCGESGRAN